MAGTIPAGAFRIEVSATYNRDTISRELRRGMSLPPQTWGKVVVEEGELILHAGADARVTPDRPGIIPPLTPYRIADTGGPVLFHIEQFHEPKLTDAALLAAQLGGSRPGAR